MDSVSERRNRGRPLATTREAVEQVALTLMLERGYDEVSVEAIASAAGIGRTTFFRYFGAKPGVIWSAFDDTIGWLKESIDQAGAETDALDTVRTAILDSTRSAIHSSEVWLERFKLLDSTPTLRAGAYEHWEEWNEVIANFVAMRVGCKASEVWPMAITGACQGTFVAGLRSWIDTNTERDHLLTTLDGNLRELFDVVRPLLLTAGRQP